MKRTCKKDHDDHDDRKRFRLPRSSDVTARSGPHVFKVLCPERLCAAILGDKGSMIQQMRDRTSCDVILSRRGECYPNTQCRTCVISAAEPADILGALDMVCDRIVSCAEGEKISEKPEFLGLSPGEYRIRCLVTKSAARSAIGPKGDNISFLREETGCKILFENEAHNYHQAVTVIATVDRIMNALKKLNDLVQDEVDQPWFSSWMQQMPCDERFERDDWQSREEKPEGEFRRRPVSDSRSRTPFSQSKNAQYPQEIAWLGQLVNTVPKEYLDNDYSIACNLRSSACASLIGHNGAKVVEIERLTLTKITFEKCTEGGAGDFRVVTIIGPLLCAYAAHMMLMKDYNDSEHSVEIDEKQAKIDELHKQLQALKRQVGVGQNR